MKKGDIYFATLTSVCPGETCVQYGRRPVVILGNRAAIQFSPVLTVLPISTKKKQMPSHVCISNTDLDSGKIKESYILTEQIRTIDRSALCYKIGHLNNKSLKKVEHTLRSQLAIM